MIYGKSGHCPIIVMFIPDITHSFFQSDSRWVLIGHYLGPADRLTVRKIEAWNPGCCFLVRCGIKMFRERVCAPEGINILAFHVLQLTYNAEKRRGHFDCTQRLSSFEVSFSSQTAKRRKLCLRDVRISFESGLMISAKRVKQRIQPSILDVPLSYSTQHFATPLIETPKINCYLWFSANLELIEQYFRLYCYFTVLASSRLVEDS